MERAAEQCVDWLTASYPPDTPFVVLCGCGNNGGDGLAIARLLHRKLYAVKAFVLKHADSFSPDCFENLKRLQDRGEDLATLLQPDAFITDIAEDIVLIDALLGTGLNRPVAGWLEAFIRQINRLPHEKVAIDMPSGMPADSIDAGRHEILAVQHTLSFQFYKRSFLHPESGELAGQVHLLDIGLHSAFISATHTNYWAVTPQKIQALYRPRRPFAHKGDYGHAMLAGGSYGQAGAIALAAKAALRSGAGKVTVCTAEAVLPIVQLLVPEAMCRAGGAQELTQIQEPEGTATWGVGPGLGTNPQTARALLAFMEANKQAMVLDADALNILAAHPDKYAKIPPGSILTPHYKECTRLFGTAPDSMMLLEQVRTQAMRLNVYVVLKGHRTIIITPEGTCWYNLTGNAGMATAGSGDVLAGMLTGLLAQGYAPLSAAWMGVYLHGLAGDLAAARLGQEALMAGDLIDFLPDAYKTLRSARAQDEQA
jgi:NAD(P)H-hydrate epimerase